MTHAIDIHTLRTTGSCIPPIVLKPVVDDPEFIRTLARSNGPYAQPGRQRVPPGLVWPSWRAHWATESRSLLEGTEALLHHDGFISAAAEMCGRDRDRIAPEGICLNLTTPSGGQPVSHTDMPEFWGVDRNNAESWFLQAMGASGLFERERITAITAVAWFHRGERGFFRYWPAGRDAPSMRQEDMWNTAVVGDNDFMHHKVERTGPRDLRPPADMTIDTLLDHDGESWAVVDDGLVLARYAEDQVRISVSWRAHVLEDTRPESIALDDVHARFASELGAEFAAASTEELFSPASRKQLIARWPGFRPD